MTTDLTPYLDDLESRLDPAVETDLHRQWVEFLEGRFRGTIFTPRRQRAVPTRVTWPTLSINQAMADYTAMALHQFRGVSDLLASGGGGMPCVRCNHGVGILPTVFGARLFYMEDEQNCLPNVWPLDGGLDTIRRLLDRGVPDLHGGLGEKVFAMGARFRELIAPYPNLRRWLYIYHPDLQGPMDVCELLWGSSIFMDMIDDPDLVHRLLDLIVETYIAFLRHWYTIVPPTGDYSAHWSLFHKGRIVIRDDSAMNFSPAMVETFIRPRDQRLLDEFGGGCIHFCGKGDHYIRLLGEMRQLYGINMSQPELNDMETIFRHTVDRGIPLIGFSRAAAEKAVAAGRDLRGRVHAS